MAELADALDLGSSALWLAGSSPASRTSGQHIRVCEWSSRCHGIDGFGGTESSRPGVNFVHFYMVQHSARGFDSRPTGGTP